MKAVPLDMNIRALRMDLFLFRLYSPHKRLFAFEGVGVVGGVGRVVAG